MSENKYQPPVNMPEKIPGILVQFLFPNGTWGGFDAKDIGLSQKDETTVTISARVGDQIVHLLTFANLKLVPVTENTVVVP